MKRLKILILEDNTADADLLQYELRRAKIDFASQVVSTQSGFIKAIEDFKPDIILSDSSMPGFDGLSALKIAKKKLPQIPFVFVSGTMGEERAIEALKSGATDYILKHHLQGLVPKVKRALRESKEREEKAQAEKKLRKSQIQLAEAQQVGRIGNWEYDFNTKELVWSDETYRIFGLIPQEIVPSEELLLSFIHPEDREYVKQFRKNAYEAERNFSFYFRIIRKNDEAVRWIFTKAQFKSKDSKLFGIVQDVTELKETEQRLEEKNKELRTFIYKTSHNLRGPIASSMGLCNLGQMEFKEFPDPYKYFEMMNDSLKNLDKIICSLIDVMAQKEAGVEKVQIDFQKLIDEILLRLSHMEGFARINFNVHISCSNYFSDILVLNSILQNIIENAIKYQNIKEAHPEVNIHIIQHAKHVEIQISDNGIGIEDNVKDHVFNMFYRGNMNAKGSGLGLYIVKNEVESLKGTIRLSSTYGRGTAFTIALPV